MPEDEVPTCPICDQPFYDKRCYGCGFDEEEEYRKTHCKCGKLVRNGKHVEDKGDEGPSKVSGESEG